MDYKEIYDQEEKDINNTIESLKKYIDKENELVQYIIVNKDLNMSAGKIAAQVGHVCTICSVVCGRWTRFLEWYGGDQKKIVLQGHLKDLERLEKISNENITKNKHSLNGRFYSIRDNGLTEIAEGSFTAISLGIMTRKEAELYIKRLQLLK
jgi:PTH2 family peptidyl-tRNA hydrolase